MRMLLFIGFVLLFIVAAYGYAGWRLIGGSGLRGGGARVAWLVLALFLLLPLGMFLLQVVGEWGPSSTMLVWPAYITLGFLSFVVTLLMVRDAAWILTRLLRVLGKKARMRSVSGPVSAERRLFLARASSLGVVGTAAALTGYGIIRARRTPPVVPVDVPVRGLHPDLEGFTIVQITDVHAGLTVGRSFVEAIVEQANTQAADLVVVTGDMVDGSVAVGLFNLNDTDTRRITISWDALSIHDRRECMVRDLWKCEDVGIFTRRFSEDVPPHGSRIFKITPQRIA